MHNRSGSTTLSPLYCRESASPNVGVFSMKSRQMVYPWLQNISSLLVASDSTVLDTYGPAGAVAASISTATRFLCASCSPSHSVIDRFYGFFTFETVCTEILKPLPTADTLKREVVPHCSRRILLKGTGGRVKQPKLFVPLCSRGSSCLHDLH